MNKKLVVLAALSFSFLGAQAKVKLPHILGNNMILQQNAEANLWGWDKPGTEVNVTASWSSQKWTAKTDKDGKWQVKVQTPKASYMPLSITFDDGEPVTLSNILAGEVWRSEEHTSGFVLAKATWKCQSKVSATALWKVTIKRWLKPTNTKVSTMLRYLA